jgi:hypothetical protein
MDQTKLFGMFANAVAADEIRLLNDLELTFAAGGDGIVIWNPPPKPELP